MKLEALSSSGSPAFSATPSQPPRFCRNLATSTRSKVRPESELWAAHVLLSPSRLVQ